MSFHVPNEYRIREGVVASKDSDGNYGAFVALFKGEQYLLIASEGLGWEHVSISPMRNKMPSWNAMCFFKDMFWDAEDCVVQYHPPKSEYVNNHPYCLHLWRPVNKEIPRPDPALVGKVTG